MKTIKLSRPLAEHVVSAPDGSDFTLHYDFRAFRLMEQELGTNPLTEGFTLKIDNFDLVLWAGIVPDNPSVSYETVRSWINPENMIELFSFTADAYFSAFPAKKEGEAPADPTQA